MSTTLSFREDTPIAHVPLRDTILVLTDTENGEASKVREILEGTGGYTVVLDLAAGPPPILIIPVVGPSKDPGTVLAEIRATAPETMLLPVLDKKHLPRGVERLLPHVTDFLVAPVREAELVARVSRIFPQDPRHAVHSVRDRLTESLALERLRGADPAFDWIKRQILLAAKADATVLVTGETGTGKELAAQAVHYLSHRAAKPFLPVDCGAIPAELFENELFGHQRGAFTDARAPQRGLVAEAEGGTLFLDEIDALSLPTQVKLLRFLEAGHYRPLGAPRPMEADVRVVAATNTDLRQKVREGTFRADLYYRLHVVTLHMLPLRERGGDIALLAEYFLEHYGKGDERWRLSAEALEAMGAYAWPGNVRELENLIRHVVVMNAPKEIRAADLGLPRPPGRLDPGGGSFRAAKAHAVAHFERNYLEGLLQTHRGNITQAARNARQDRRTFRRLLQKHALEAASWARPL